MRKNLIFSVVISLVFAITLSALVPVHVNAAPASPYARRIVNAALNPNYRGAPYVLGASSLTTRVFDCSSFTQRVIWDAGIGRMPRTARAQQAFLARSSRVRRVSGAQLQPGDLLYWKNLGSHVPAGTVSHTGIYIGNGRFIHASPGKGVAIDRLNGIYVDPRRTHSAYRIIR